MILSFFFRVYDGFEGAKLSFIAYGDNCAGESWILRQEG
jgi:hypothetical protein